MFIQQAEAIMEDDIIQLGQYRTAIFHRVNDIKTYDDDYTDMDGYLIAVYLRYDKSYDSYERKVDDIMTLLGDVGGLQGILFMFGQMLVGFFASKYFMSKIIRKIYQIRKYENFLEDGQEDKGSLETETKRNSQKNSHIPVSVKKKVG